MNKFSIGADPEYFAQNSFEFISCVEKVGGSKESPLQLEGLPLGFAVQEDNVAIEGCVPPAYSKEEYVHNITTLRQALENILKSIGLEMSDKCSAHFPLHELFTQKAAEFGCSEEFCYFRKPPIRIYALADEPNFRTAGGHVHIGYEGHSPEKNRLLVALLDMTLGLPSLVYDPDTMRRRLYGKAGMYRDKPFGVEYRVLSNFWTFNPALIEWVYDGVSRALKYLPFVDSTFIKCPLNTFIREVINSQSTELIPEALSYIENFFKQLENGNSNSNPWTTWKRQNV